MKDLKKELQGLPNNFILAVVMPSSNYEDTNINILKYFLNSRKLSGKYIALNRPYSSIVEELKANQINTTNLSFIDCITKELGSKVIRSKDVTYVDGPNDLTNLGIALHKYFASSSDTNRILYLDSISSMFLHNDNDQVMRFIHYLTGKMRVFGLNGLMLTLHEDTDKKLIGELGQFCDKIIRL
tara:strand:+ start:312 stop:863 length:552 start_codon:yes stop_codon:yes gene_type:complete